MIIVCEISETHQGRSVRARWTTQVLFSADCHKLAHSFYDIWSTTDPAIDSCLKKSSTITDYLFHASIIQL